MGHDGHGQGKDGRAHGQGQGHGDHRHDDDHVHDHAHDHDHDHDHDHAHDHDHDHRGAEGAVRSVDEHRAQAPTTVSAFVVTCSDTRTQTTDEGGALIRSLLEGAGHTVVGTALVKDDGAEIRRAVEEAIGRGARVVLVTGGTGLSRRDVTVETLAPLFEKTLPGFGELFRMLSWDQVKSAAMLSRAVAGVMKGAVVFALPGSPAAVRLAMQKLILPEVGHLVREVLR